jgi:D-alanyl-D-alanine dipeptidase
MAHLLYERIPVVENHDPLVDLADYPFVCEPVYYRQGLSDSPKLFTRQAIAGKLIHLQNTSLDSFRFKIWDPWRSPAVQHKLFSRTWEKMRLDHPEWDDVRLRSEVCVYVADPTRADRVPSHSTGGSIDLTLINRTTGNELNMGTAFDHIGIEANPAFFENSSANPHARDNRRILGTAMLSVGFTQDPDEWWHFDYGNQKWAEAAAKGEAFYGAVTAPEQLPTPPSPAIAQKIVHP